MQPHIDFYERLKTYSTIDRRFCIGGVIGTGASSIVVRATQRSLDRPVALKILNETIEDEQLWRFQQEADMLARLDHPSIVKLYDVGEIRNHAYLALEYMDGGSLRDRLLDLGSMPWARAVRVMIQVLSGLKACHLAGIVHRDVKPANILFTQANDAKIADFGLSRFSERWRRRTVLRARIGTPLYMSPEVAAGGEAGPASDAYSAGVVLYELLSGFPPFYANSGAAVMRLHMESRPAPIRANAPDVPPVLEQVLDTALEKDPKMRYANAGEFLDALTALLPGKRSRKRSPAGPESARTRWLHRLRAILVGSVLGTLFHWIVQFLSSQVGGGR
jgi:serine/threonine protein kinase